MSYEEIRDKNFNIMGHIEECGDELVARDRNFNILGYYRNGRTYDMYFNFIAEGNILSALIYNLRRD